MERIQRLLCVTQSALATLKQDNVVVTSTLKAQTLRWCCGFTAFFYAQTV